jgi:hypothetical protein
MKMRLILVAAILCVHVFPLCGQTPVAKSTVQISIGPAKHGSGDLNGFIFNTGYTRFFSKRLSWSADIGGSIHDGSRLLIYTDPNGNAADGSIRHTTAGFQVTGGLGYSVANSGHHELQLRLHSLLRYQSSSTADIYTILYPAATSLPVPVLYFQHLEPARTYAAGGHAQVAYHYTTNNRLLFGISGAFQMDTNGDVLPQLLFRLGKRFH